MLQFIRINEADIESGRVAVLDELNIIAVQKNEAPRVSGRLLTEADAVEIWIARWLRIRPKDLAVRYGCDPKRFYEIWWSKRFVGSRERAADVFSGRYPSLVDRTVFGYRRIARQSTAPREQLDLFAPPDSSNCSPQVEN